MDIGLLLLRLVLGLGLAAHGAQKLFGMFGGYGLKGTGGYFESLGFRPGHAAALMAGCAEFFGGLFLALGLLTPFAAGVIIAVMLVAIVSVHLPKGYFNEKGGFELNLLIATSALALAFLGAGRISLDGAMQTEFNGIEWGVTAALIGIAGALAALAGRALSRSRGEAHA